MSGKEVTIANTQINAGPRRSSEGNRPPGSRRQSTQQHDDAGEPSQRLKWDEANLYLTEQERTSTMKINEPKTPYAKHYDPAEDPSDDDEVEHDENGVPVPVGPHGAGRPPARSGAEDDIPGFSLGEPEEEFSQAEAPPAEAGEASAQAAASSEAAGARGRSRSGSSGAEKTVHVDSDSVAPSAEDDMVGLSPEEREKHRKFEEARKKHYEMKDVAQLLGHPEVIDEDEDDDADDEMPPVPPMPRGVNGSA